MLAFAILDWLDAGRTSPRRASAITITGLDQTIKKANKDRTYKRIPSFSSVFIQTQGSKIWIRGRHAESSKVLTKIGLVLAQI